MHRIFSTPLSEQEVIGFVIALAAKGYTLLPEIEFADYLFLPRLPVPFNLMAPTTPSYFNPIRLEEPVTPRRPRLKAPDPAYTTEDRGIPPGRLLSGMATPTKDRGLSSTTTTQMANNPRLSCGRYAPSFLVEG